MIQSYPFIHHGSPTQPLINSVFSPQQFLRGRAELLDPLLDPVPGLLMIALFLDIPISLLSLSLLQLQVAESKSFLRGKSYRGLIRKRAMTT
jgi:hypothetical protein